jgi:hypothetical protein
MQTMSDTPTSNAPHKPTLCVDFDGVIHSYTSGWKGEATIPDEPVPGALEWLHRVSRSFNVVIYSSRSKEPAGRAAMQMWLTFHVRRALPESAAETVLSTVAFAHNKPSAFLTIDDRAICFDGTWGALDPEKLLAFKPWHQRATTAAKESERPDGQLNQPQPPGSQQAAEGRD